MKRITPILSVEDIELCLDFWVKKLGFQVTAEVKEGDKLGFVILMSDTKELMLQSLSSIKNDIPALEMELKKSPSVLYIEVADIEDIEKKLEGYEIIVPKRKTFYGATEIFYRSPGGHFIGFAQMGDASSGQ